MKIYQIWIEGYQATCEKRTAQLMGQVAAKTFREACIRFARSPDAVGWGVFDEKELSFWGCRLFDNETNARKGFG